MKKLRSYFHFFKKITFPSVNDLDVMLCGNSMLKRGELRFIVVVLGICLFCSPVSAQERLYFGAFEPEAFTSGNGTIMNGYYEKGHFVRQPELASLRHPFLPGQQAFGLTASGRIIPFRVKAVLEPEGDLYEGILDLLAQAPLPARTKGSLYPLLLIPMAASVQPVTSLPAKLSTEVDKQLRESAAALFSNALQEKGTDKRTAKLVLETPEVKTVEGVSDLLLVRYPASVSLPGGPQEDNRASLFFIYSSKDSKIILGKFGHPEWSTAEKSIVLTVRPWVFFRIGKNTKIYFLGEHQCGWECNGFAIYDLRTGQSLLETY